MLENYFVKQQNKINKIKNFNNKLDEGYMTSEDIFSY